MVFEEKIFNSLSTGLIIVNPNSNYLVEKINLAATEFLNLDLERINLDISKSHPQISELLSKLKKQDAEFSKKKRIELNINGQYLNAIITKLNGNYLIEITKMVQKDLGKTTHELKRPIQNIKTLSESLILGAKDDAKMRDKFIQNINEEADRMARLVSDLLRLSSLEQGTAEIHKTKIQTKTNIDEIIKSFSNKAKEKNISINNKIDPDHITEADKNLFIHLFENLIENAINYNTKNGSVSIKISNDNFIEVKDTGIGIEEEELNKIFEKYYRGKNTLETQGSGLGLSIIKSIVELHGGQIKLESTPKIGTIFKIQL